jgi:serine/threonine-protein kinase
MAIGRGKATKAVGRYQLAHEIAASYLGPLWLVRVEGSEGPAHLAMLRLVSLARLDADTRVRLLEAAWQAMEVRDTHVSSVTDVVASDGELGVVSDYVEGLPLRALQGLASVRRKQMPVPVALCIVNDLVLGVASLHRTAIELGDEAVPLYGGLSPDSVFVGADGRSSVLDVAVASVASVVETLGGNAERTAYAAPEQLGPAPRADARTDVFAIGVLAWELLASRRLFIGADKAVAQKVLTAKIPRLDEVKRKGDPEVPGAVLAVVMRALERDPESRFQSVEELGRALADAGGPFADGTAVAGYVAEIAEGALGRARDAITDSPRARPVAPPTVRPKPTGPVRPTATVPLGEVRKPPPIRVAPKADATSRADNTDKADKAQSPPPMRPQMASPRPRQPTMIGIPAPSARETADAAKSLGLALDKSADKPTIPAQADAPGHAPTPSAVGATLDDAPRPLDPDLLSEEIESIPPTGRGPDSEDPTGLYSAQELLKQVQQVARRSEPARRPHLDFPEPATEPRRVGGRADVPRVAPPGAGSPVPDAQADGGWLDDPLSTPGTARAAPVPDEREVFPPWAPPEPRAARDAGVAGRPPRSLAPVSSEPAAPSQASTARAPERPALSRPPPAATPSYLPSQMPPPLIHDPRANLRPSARPPSAPQATRNVVVGVVVSVVLVIASAAIAITVLRGRETADPSTESGRGASRSDGIGAPSPPAEAPAELEPKGAPPVPTAAAVASTEPSNPRAPDATAAAVSTAAPAASAPVAAVAAAPVTPPAPRPPARAPARRATPKNKGRFVPNDI